MNLFKKMGVALTVVAGSSLLSVGSAVAALPTEVTDAFTAAKTDGVTAAGLVLVIIVSIVAFKYIRKAL